jgi:nicotinate dehydrogenase subunit A
MNDETRFGFVLNGKPVEVQALRDEPLLYVLRDRLGLRGTRFGCGLNQCGACRVEIDNRLAPACDTPIWSVEGRSVTTIEGLSAESCHSIQEVLERFQAGQCGACLSGIIMTLRHVLEQGGAVSEADLREKLDEHLCRCGSHSRIVAAALYWLESRAKSPSA